MAVLPTDYTNSFTPTGATTELPATTTRGINAINTEVNTKLSGVGPTANLTALQSQVTVAGTVYYVTGSGLLVPTDLAVGSRCRWTIAMAKTAAGTGAFNIHIKRGTAGTTADTSDVTQSIGTGTAVVDNMMLDIELTVTAVGASGSYFWCISPTTRASTTTPAGFGTPFGPTGQFSGTVSAVALNTASLKFGIAFANVTGTPTITVPMVRANLFR
jgi:hypothetical protein